MWRIRELKPSFVWFYTFGQTTYIPLKSDENKYLLLLFALLPNLVSAIFYVSQATLIILQTYPDLTKNFLINKLLANWTMFGFTSNFVVGGINLTNPFLSRNILMKFATIIQYMETRLQMNVSLAKFERNYR